MSTEYHQMNVQSDQHSNDVIDLRMILGLLKAHCFFITFIVALCLVLGGLYAYTRPAVFESTALIKVEGDSNNALNLAAMLGMADGMGSTGLGKATPAEIETALIQSDYIMGAVASRLNLDVIAEPNYVPVVGEFFVRLIGNEDDYSIDVRQFVVPKTLAGIKFTLTLKDDTHYVLFLPNGKKVLTGIVGQVSSQLYENEIVTLDVASIKGKKNSTFTIIKQPTSGIAQLLGKNLTIKEQGEGTGILELSYRSNNPEYSQRVLNGILDVAVEKNIAEKAKEATKTVSFLQNQLPNISEDLDAAESRLTHYRSKTGAVDSTIEAQILLGEVVDIEHNIEELSLKKLELLQNFTPKHPYILALEEQQQTLNEKLQQLKNNLRQIPVIAQDAVNLERDIQVHGEIYSGVMQNLQQMQILKGSTVSSVSVLEGASFSIFAIPSKTPLIILVSMVLGAFLAIAFILLRETLSHVIDPLTLERLLKIPVLSVVPFSHSQNQLSEDMKAHKGEKKYLLCLEKPKDIAVEAIRGLRTALRLTMVSPESKKVIAISGCSPNIGKTFISCNLTSLLSDLGEKVLLIDADMRKGTLSKVFGVNRSSGLSDYLKGQITLEKAKKKVLEHVDFISTGDYPQNPVELLMHPRFEELIKIAKDTYDAIIIDTPPLLAVTDANLIFKLSDIKLLIVGSGKNQLREIEHAKSMLEKSGNYLDGIVYNNLMKVSKRYGYGYGYGYYNYHYKYE